MKKKYSLKDVQLQFSTIKYEYDLEYDMWIDKTVVVSVYLEYTLLFTFKFPSSYFEPELIEKIKSAPSHFLETDDIKRKHEFDWIAENVVYYLNLYIKNKHKPGQHFYTRWELKEIENTEKLDKNILTLEKSQHGA